MPNAAQISAKCGARLHFDLVFGDSAKSWVIHVIPDYHGFLLAILPPGAFIGLGLIIAAKNWLDLRAARKARSQPMPAALPEAAQG